MKKERDMDQEGAIGGSLLPLLSDGTFFFLIFLFLFSDSVVLFS